MIIRALASIRFQENLMYKGPFSHDNEVTIADVGRRWIDQPWRAHAWLCP